MSTHVNSIRVRFKHDLYIDLPVTLLEVLRSLDVKLDAHGQPYKGFKLKWDEDGLLTVQGKENDAVWRPFLDQEGKWVRRRVLEGPITEVSSIDVDQLEAEAEGDAA